MKIEEPNPPLEAFFQASPVSASVVEADKAKISHDPFRDHNCQTDEQLYLAYTISGASAKIDQAVHLAFVVCRLVTVLQDMRYGGKTKFRVYRPINLDHAAFEEQMSILHLILQKLALHCNAFGLMSGLTTSVDTLKIPGATPEVSLENFIKKPTFTLLSWKDTDSLRKIFMYANAIKMRIEEEKTPVSFFHFYFEYLAFKEVLVKVMNTIAFREDHSNAYLLQLISKSARELQPTKPFL